MRQDFKPKVQVEVISGDKGVLPGVVREKKASHNGSISLWYYDGFWKGADLFHNFKNHPFALFC